MRHVERATDLPEAWDRLSTSIFQRQEFLEHLERTNPCRQRYYWLVEDGRPVAGAILYTLRLDLLTFLRVPSPVRISFLGIPCSVSAPGLLGSAKAASKLVDLLLREQRGLVVGLNLDFPLFAPGLAVGRTLPTVLLDRRFSSWRDYRASLRSPYRRRLDRTLAAWKGVRSERGSCGRFDGEMHRLYLDVYRHSDAKLERLDIEFFRQLPPPFFLTTHRRDGRLLGWHIGVTDGRRRFFVLGGVDYTKNEHERTYMNLLAALLREAIEDGCDSVDFGQTAEVPKMRLGGRLVEKGMFGWHSSRPVRRLLTTFRGALEYRRRVPDAHVFAEGATR